MSAREKPLLSIGLLIIAMNMVMIALALTTTSANATLTTSSSLDRERHIYRIILEEAGKPQYEGYLPLDFNAVDLVKIIMEEERLTGQEYSDFDIEFKAMSYIINEAAEEERERK